MKMKRREFIKGAAAAGALALLANATKGVLDNVFRPAKAQATSDKEKYVYSLCLGCNVRCGIRVRVEASTGRAVRVEGNPYHPNNNGWNPIPYSTPTKDSLNYAVRICLKGTNAGIDHVYDPYRVRVPLKRAGPRGSMKWKPISWEQLITEVVDGGAIYSDIGENVQVEGFKDVAADMTTPANEAVLKASDAPKAHQIVVLRGRGQPGRIEFLNARWLSGALGSASFIAHDAICANGVQTTHKAMTIIGKDKYEGQIRTVTSDDYADQLRVDIKHAKFIIAFGDPYSAGQPAIVPAGAILPDRLANGDLKLVVVDPRAGNVVTNATKWIPVKPGTDGALMMGMIRWIIENKWYNKFFLENTTETSANKDGEKAWTSGTFLVITGPEDDPDHLKYLRGKRLAGTDPADSEKYVTWDDSATAIFDKVDHGTLFFEGEIQDKDGVTIQVKTALQMLKDKAFEKTMDEWAQICGIDINDLKWLAQEFTSYGKSAGMLVYRVFGVQPNGVYTVMAMISLHMLIGNINWRGGYLQAASFSWTKGVYDLDSFPDKLSPKKAPISREKFKYEDTNEYANKPAGQKYPATKPWFPKTYGGLWTEVFESIKDNYPYSCKILITYFGNPIFIMPSGHKYIEVIKDTDKVPIHIAIDAVISETSMYADYIVPDVVGLEGSYGLMPPYPPCMARWIGVRIPSIEPLVSKVSAVDDRPVCAETFAIDVVKRLANVHGKPSCSGFLKIGDKELNRAEDYFLRAIVNLANNASSLVQAASDEEAKFVEDNYPKSFVDYAKSILSDDEWRKVCYIIVRGGVFEQADSGFEAQGQHKYAKKNIFRFWVEEFAALKHWKTGEHAYWGSAQYVPPQNMDGNSLDDLDKDYKYVCVSYKSGLHTQSRTIGYRWAREVIPENAVEMNEDDAANEGLKDGDTVKIVSSSLPDGVAGKVRVTKRVGRGVVAIMFHYGHWAWGNASYEIEGQGSISGDPSRGAGIWVNKLTRIDESTKAPVVDPISGAATTSGFRVNLIKV